MGCEKKLSNFSALSMSRMHPIIHTTVLFLNFLSNYSYSCTLIPLPCAYCSFLPAAASCSALFPSLHSSYSLQSTTFLLHPPSPTGMTRLSIINDLSLCQTDERVREMRRVHSLWSRAARLVLKVRCTILEGVGRGARGGIDWRVEKRVDNEMFSHSLRQGRSGM